MSFFPILELLNLALTIKQNIMAQETKVGDTVYEDEESQKESLLIEHMMGVFSEKYKPSPDAAGCDLKSTWEIQEMFSEIISVPKATLATNLMDLGFKTTLIGNEFKWILRPISSF